MHLDHRFDRAIRRGRARREDVAVFAADHHLDDFIVGLCAGLEGRDIAAIAEHGAFIGKFGDLVHAMRDVEQRQTFIAQAFQNREHLGDVGRGQGGCCFIEDQDARVAGECLGDFDHLAARERQVLDRRHGMDVLGTGARQCGLRQSALGLAIDHAEALWRVR